ncbi:MAG: hypothetical protein L6R19_01855 [Alphaproteobacteria bacterium]|nr:hypothetical protein [Alphaproteobacteria bacterium]
MTPVRFAELVDAYGADPRRWPEAEREAALAFLERAPEARTTLEAARRLDALIDAWPLPAAAPDPAHLTARAARAAQEAPAGNVVPFAPRRKPPVTLMAWARAGALAAAGICGLVIGMSDPTVTNNVNGLDVYDVAQVEDASW